MPTLHPDALSTTALALLLLALGSQLKKRSRWLTRLCVPSPVIAGFGFAFWSGCSGIAAGSTSASTPACRRP